MDQDLAIKVQNLSKTFKISKNKNNTLKEFFLHPLKSRQKVQFQALENINFEIKKGEWVGIIGKNGSGKSTLLKILAGVYQPDSGEVKISGKVIPFLELGVGFNMELTARENIFLNGSILGLSKKEIEEKFDQIVDFAEIRRFLDTPVKNFSSGMKVRLAFAVAMQADGDIYLLDEVLAVGDLDFQRKCFEVMEYLRQKNKTIIFVSHSVLDINRFCDRGIYLSDNCIIKDDRAVDVVSFYQQQHSRQKQKKELSKYTRWGNGKASIIDYNIFDKDNNQKNLFAPAGKARIKVKFNLKNVERETFNVGLSINKGGEKIFETSTYMNSIILPPGKDEVVLEFNLENFLPGKYDLVCGLTCQNDWRDPYDAISNYRYFRILGEEKFEGYFTTKYDWL